MLRKRKITTGVAVVLAAYTFTTFACKKQPSRCQENVDIVTKYI